MKQPGVLVTDLRRGFHEVMPVPFVLEISLPPIAVPHDVVDGREIPKVPVAGHAFQLLKRTGVVKAQFTKSLSDPMGAEIGA